MAPKIAVPSRLGRTSAEDRSSVIDSDFGDITEQPADPVDDEGLVPEAPDFVDTPPDDPPIPIVPDIDVAELVPTSALTQLAQAITTLARHAGRPPPPSSSALRTKVREPEQFDGTEPRKLRVFQVQCELNFQDRPLAFASDRTKVIFAQSYLKGMALDWFEPDLLFDQNPLLCPRWMNDYQEFVKELQTNFGPYDPVGDTEVQLMTLEMKDGHRINKYVVEFNRHASQLHRYGEAALCRLFYDGLPKCIKDNIAT